MSLCFWFVKTRLFLVKLCILNMAKNTENKIVQFVVRSGKQVNAIQNSKDRIHIYT